MERNAASERLRELMKNNLRERFPLFSETHRVDACPLRENAFWIGYRTGADNLMHAATHFDLNIENDICYLLHVWLEKDSRGKGLGRSLYDSIHTFARQALCRVVRQTPSGGVFIDGKMVESRRDYLLRMGYAPLGEHELELVL